MSATKVILSIFWDASGVFYTGFLTKGLTVNSDRYCAKLRSLKQRIHRIRPDFASRQCMTALQCTDTGRLGKTEIHSGSTTFLQSRFGTVRNLPVPKIEEDVQRSAFFKGCRSSGSRAQMDAQSTRNFLLGRNEEMDRTIEQMCNC
ncbi:hypothetical protein TNCV_4332901 [Trichonephila clavipes]|nr:hypothetical protein TNCV_4332901 [Trichonephila clavipes]